MTRECNSENPSKNASIESEESYRNDTVQSQQAKQEKKAITVVGDSILNGTKERGLSGKHQVRVKAHPGGDQSRSCRSYQTDCKTQARNRYNQPWNE